MQQKSRARGRELTSNVHCTPHRACVQSSKVLRTMHIILTEPSGYILTNCTFILPISFALTICENLHIRVRIHNRAGRWGGGVITAINEAQTSAPQTEEDTRGEKLFGETIIWINSKRLNFNTCNAYRVSDSDKVYYERHKRLPFQTTCTGRKEMFNYLSDIIPPVFILCAESYTNNYNK